MGIALRQSDPGFEIVDAYYARAKRERTRRGDLEIGSTDAFRSNFLDLVRMLDAKQQSHVVVVAHGSDGGLLMPLSARTSDEADNEALARLLELVNQHPAVDASAVTAFVTDYNIPEDDVRALVAVCIKVRHHDSNCVAVHIRGCKIGANIENLDTIRELFDSIVVSAAKCPMLYSPFEPFWSRPADKDVDAWKSANPPDSRRREFVDPAKGLSRLVLDANYAGAKSSAQGVIQHADDLAKWANLFYGNITHGVQRQMPVAAMWTDTGYFLAHEQGYIDQIVASRVT